MPYLVQGAALAPTTTSLLSSTHLRRLIVAFVAIALAITMIAIEAPIATQAYSASDADRVVSYAQRHVGARFRIGSTGMRYFDCSGLVYRVYQQAGLVRKIGGTRKRAATYYKWFRQRGLASRSNPRVGDLIWWSKNGRIVHTGIYVGGNRAISALINPWGVSRHGVNLSIRLVAYGHTRLSQ